MIITGLELTVTELRQIAHMDPKDLPALMVHDLSTWRNEVQMDALGRLHMNDLQLIMLKKNLPVELVGRLNAHTRIFGIALRPHHLEGGVNDRIAPGQTLQARKERTRIITGRDPVTAGKLHAA